MDITPFFKTQNYTFQDEIYDFGHINEAEDVFWCAKSACSQIDDVFLNLAPTDRRYPLAIDVGAGTGRATQPLHSISDHVIALDPSIQALDHIKSRQLDNVSFVANYTFNLPFHDNLFDFVSCITVIEHIPSEHHDAFIKELFRILKPGGHLMIRNDAWFYGILERMHLYDKEPDKTHVNMITPKRLKKDLIRLGGKVLHEAYFPYYRYSSKLKLPLMNIFSTKGNFLCTK